MTDSLLKLLRGGLSQLAAQAGWLEPCLERDLIEREIRTAMVAVDRYADGGRTPSVELDPPWPHATLSGLDMPVPGTAVAKPTGTRTDGRKSRYADKEIDPFIKGLSARQKRQFKTTLRALRSWMYPRPLWTASEDDIEPFVNRRFAGERYKRAERQVVRAWLDHLAVNVVAYSERVS